MNIFFLIGIILHRPICVTEDEHYEKATFFKEKTLTERDMGAFTAHTIPLKRGKPKTRC